MMSPMLWTLQENMDAPDPNQIDVRLLDLGLPDFSKFVTSDLVLIYTMTVIANMIQIAVSTRSTLSVL